MSGRWRLVVVGGVLGLGALAWLWSRAVEGWRFESGLERARGLIRRGAYAEAVPGLERLAAGRPDRGEPALLLGDAEDALGHSEAALRAWARVPPGSPEAPLAASRRGALAAEVGRFAEAEEALDRAARAGGPRGQEARERLIRLLWRECRFAESAAMIEAQWRDLRDSGRLAVDRAVDLLRGHLAVDLETFPADPIEAELRALAARPSGDDGVRLALARWATRGGRLAEAATILEDCARRRPDDPAVWLARLDWDREADRPDEAVARLARVPADRLTARDLAALGAWLAAGRGDPVAERARLESLRALDPGDLAAIDRLAELAARAGDPEAVGRLRARKAALVEARNRYTILFKDDDLAARASEMGRLAADLGRRFEAGAFAYLAVLRDPMNPGLREALGRHEIPPPPPAPAAPTGPSPTSWPPTSARSPAARHRPPRRPRSSPGSRTTRPGPASPSSSTAARPRPTSSPR